MDRTKYIVIILLMLLLVGCEESTPVSTDVVNKESWLMDNGVKIVSQRAPTNEEIDTLYSQMQLIPTPLLRIVMGSGSGIDIILGTSIVEHPQYAYLKGQRPRGWPEGTTWDMCPGVGGGPGQPAVVAIHGLSGSVNVLIHETGHTVNLCMGGLSAGGDWQAVWTTLQPLPQILQYEKDYADEAFAEGLARYLVGPPPRDILPGNEVQYMDSLISRAKDMPVIGSKAIRPVGDWTPLNVENYEFITGR